MVGMSYKERLAILQKNLLAVPPAKLVDILITRASYDESLWHYLESITKAADAATDSVELFDLAKQFIARTYGDGTLNGRDASYHLAELYAAHSLVEQLFESGKYQNVIELFEWSLKFEDNLSEVSYPDDFLDCAYLPLAILCLKSHLRLGRTPREVAEIFNRMHVADEYGLFSKLPILEKRDLADLGPVKKILMLR